MARESYESKIDAVDFHDIDHIVFAGMGGSGAIGDIFSSILSKTSVHVSVVKGYVLPKTVDSNTLVVTTSGSGNTAETLAILDSAHKKNCKIIAFSDGGKMQEYCTRNNIEHQSFRQIHSPRASFPVFLYGMLKTLESVIPMKKVDVLESIRSLEELQKKINSSNMSNKNPALDIAAWISGIPLIYYPSGLQSAAIRFKNSLHENAKSQVFLEEISEACHNEIVSWERPANIRPILIQGQDDHITTKEKWQILKEYFGTKKIDYKEVFSVTGNILTKLINLIYLLDYASIYLAVRERIDPSPVYSIDFVKHMQHIHNMELVNTKSSIERSKV
ncbi:MAG TPA: SIS domain-containing protein [Nitrosopumilaceae archaeon]|nr:SIS domain-containing protein [Nitrosopumilaceae archaeon]